MEMLLEWETKHLWILTIAMFKVCYARAQRVESLWLISPEDEERLSYKAVIYQVI